MPSSYSVSLRFELQATGENNNTWGVRWDNTFARVDDAIAGYVSIAVTGSYALQSANDNTTADEARRAHLKFTGSPAANFNITIPSVSKSYWIWNGTNKVATITTGAGDTVSIDPGDRLQVWCDGANVETTIFGGLSLKSFIAASVLAATGTLPALTGNAGKFIKTDAVNAFWAQIASTDISDFEDAVIGLALSAQI